MPKETLQRIKIYIIAITIPLAVGITSALITRENMTVYSTLNLPPLSPPSFLFPYVWTLLYILMGISSGTVYLKRSNNPTFASDGLSYYALSLAFNFAWSIIFFNFRAFAFSFIWLLALLYLIIKTVICYKKVDKRSAKLQIPYILWVSFAGYLNLGIYLLNK
ncbi:MAG: tryptophan-rich sensory protein [Ruminococcaceae bacterium]|nr:tryptophan-rich sensory protein [Oscillospiraceae bacterium]